MFINKFGIGVKLRARNDEALKIVASFLKTINTHIAGTIGWLHAFFYDFVQGCKLKSLGARVSELQRHMDFPEFFGHGGGFKVLQRWALRFMNADNLFYLVAG